MAEIVSPQCGVLVPPSDAEALAAGVKALFDGDLPSLRAQARRTAERYAWQPLLEQMLARYRSLAGA